MEKTCENCEKNYEWLPGTDTSGRFCSKKCRYGFSTKAKRKEINQKVSKAITAHLDAGKTVGFLKKREHFYYEETCKNCQKVFITERHIFCSRSCKSSWQGKHSDHYKHIDWSKIHRDSYKKGRVSAGGNTKWFSVDTSNGIVRVQGSFEVRTCHILDKMKLKSEILGWEYTNDRYLYTGADNKLHSYLIDFKIFVNENDFYYVEVKGRKGVWDDLKWEEVRRQGYRLDIWFFDDLKRLENKLEIV